MKKLDVYTVRELREKTGAFLRDAERGDLSVVTRHGRPMLLAVPFDEALVGRGAKVAVALHLLEHGAVSLAQAAKIAGQPLEAFLSTLRDAGLPAVDHPAEDLDREMAVPL